MENYSDRLIMMMNPYAYGGNILGFSLASLTLHSFAEIE